MRLRPHGLGISLLNFIGAEVAPRVGQHLLTHMIKMRLGVREAVKKVESSGKYIMQRSIRMTRLSKAI